MKVVIGVIGPHDLVPTTIEAAAEVTGASFLPFPYTHESQAPTIVSASAGEVDAWLFTGPIPYFISSKQLTRPATYVEYSGSTLLTALIQLLRAGHDISRLSIDSLGSRNVEEALREASVPTGQTRVLEYKPGMSSDEIIQFHRAVKEKDYVVISCVSSVYEVLREEMVCIRLAPSLDAVRSAANHLLLVTTSQVNEDSHVVIGLLESDPLPPMDNSALVTVTAALSGISATSSAGDILIVTNRAGLNRASNMLSTAPLVDALEEQGFSAHLGFGTGNSVSEAERLAHRALARAKQYDRPTAVVSFRHETDVTLSSPLRASIHEAEPRQPAVGVGVAAARAGLSVANIQRLQTLVGADSEPLTTRDIATHLDVQMRTARRIVQRLELAGYATRVGQQSAELAGRPLTLYLLHL